jgi:hypothetical protein
MKNKITFTSVDEIYFDAYDKPQPAGKDVPEWFAKQSRYSNNKKEIRIHSGGHHNPNAPRFGKFNVTVKGCAAVYDAITAGYLIYTDSDLFFQKDENNQINITQNSNPYSFISRTPVEQVGEYLFDKEYYENCIFKYNTHWSMETPEGYSCIYLHPMWRDDLPFKILPGIVDQDGTKGIVNVFFLIKKNFEGVLPAGTPICQIIPFKRENWEFETKAGPSKKQKIAHLRGFRYLENAYKKTAYAKKKWY